MLTEEIISAFSPFNRLKKSQVKELLNISSLREYKKGEIIYREGENPGYFYFLVKGRVVAISSIEGREREIELIKKGTPFGIISLFTKDPHSVTTKAIENCLIVVIREDKFRNFVEKSPFLAFYFSQVLSRRVKKRADRPKRIFKSTGIVSILDGDYMQLFSVVIELAGLLSLHNKKEVIVVEASSSGSFVLPGVVGENVDTFNLDGEFREDLSVRKIKGVNFLCLKMDTTFKDELFSFGNFLLENYHFIFYIIRKEDIDYWLTVFNVVNHIYILCNRLDKDVFLSKKIKSITDKFKYIEKTVRVILTDRDGYPEVGQARKHRDEEIVILGKRGHKDYKKRLGHLERVLAEKTLGLALGSGGAYGLAHIGVLKAIAESNVPLDMVCGSSIGSVIAAMWALGFSFKDMGTAVDLLSRRIKLFSFTSFTFPFRGIVKARRLEGVFKEIFGRRSFKDVVCPLAVVAFNFKKRQIVAIDEGLIYKAVSASCAMPGIFEPVVFNNEMFLDGGVLSPLPTKILLQFDIKKIVAANVTPRREEIRNVYRKKSIFNVFDFIFGSIETMQQEFIRGSLDISDVVIHPDLGDLSWTDFSAKDEFIKRGYEATLRVLPQIKELLSG